MTAIARKIEEKLFYIICMSAAIFAAVIFFAILGQILLSALPSLTFYFLTTAESNTPRIGMGIANAIIGTIFISFFATTLAIPIALGTAIYLQKYATNKKLANSFRFFLEVLSGTPSIVIGMFGFLVLVYYLRATTGGFSLMSGAIALSILIMPVIERTIEEAISKVSRDMEEGSFALGATKWQTIRDVTIPISMGGIITGTVLGFGRAAEESAVVVLTAGYSQFMPEFAVKANSHLLNGIKIYPIQDLVGTLPYAVYNTYENSNVIPRSNAFASAFVLIVFVLVINLTAKKILSSQGSIERKDKNGSISGGILKWFKMTKERSPRSQPGQMMDSVFEPFPGKQIPRPSNPCEKPLQHLIMKPSLMEQIRPYLQVWSMKEKSPVLEKNESGPFPNNGKPASDIKTGSPIRLFSVKKFLITFLPFFISTFVLLALAIAASVPPLHSIMGPASATLAKLFASSLSIILTVAGLIFAFFIARKQGAFRNKNRRASFAAVATGFCLVCIAGLILSSAAIGLFNTGEPSGPAPKPAGDRAAQLAALLASGDLGDVSAHQSQPGDTVSPMTTPPPQPASFTTDGPAQSLNVPVKDALSLHEYYQYGDKTRTVRATVYDTKTLPFYFWWWIDYNRFVEQTPAKGNEYLVVYMRLEDTGEQSAIIPSADQFNLTYKGSSYGHKPYLNSSVFSAWQLNYYSTHYDKLPYQWIREIGQMKRDYAFQTQYITFTFANSNQTANSSSSGGNVSAGTSLDTKYTGYFIKPGSSNAIDGYLIYEVPEAVVKDLGNAYLQISFNQQSGTRWKLG